MLSYEEFKEELLKQTKEKLPTRYQDAEVELVKVPKNNDRILEGIAVRPRDKNSGAIFYCYDVYADYIKNDSFEKTFSVYMAKLLYYMEHLPETDAENYLDWEKVKDRIVPALISMRKNCENIGQLVYEPVEGTDLVVIYRIMQEMETSRGSIKITNGLMEKWGVDINQIHDRAFHNMNTILTPQIVELSPETEKGETPSAYTKLPEHMDKENMYIFTNEERFYGAASIMAAGVLPEIAERLQCSFYLLPLTVDDMAIIPKTEDESVEALQRIVLEYNICAQTEETMLSDQVYFYDDSKRELSMATNPEHTQEVVLKMLAESVQEAEQTDEENGEER